MHHSYLRPAKGGFSSGVCVALLFAPHVHGATSAIAGASLSFRAASPQGSLAVSSVSLGGGASLFASMPATVSGYADSSSGNSLAGSASLGINTAATSSSVAGLTFTSSSAVSLMIPPFSFSNGGASSFNFVDLDISGLRPVDGLFDIKISPLTASLNLTLTDDSGGATAFASASWLLSLRYSLGESEFSSDGFSLSESIGAGGNYTGSNHRFSPVEFTGIPADATGVQLYWETSVEAQTASVAARTVPEGSQSWLLLSTGLLAIEWLRRKGRRSETA